MFARATVAALVLLLLAPHVRADAPGRTSSGQRPSLAGHWFSGSPVVRDAFPKTSLQIGLSVGQALDVPFLPDIILANGDTLQGIYGDLALANFDLSYSYAVRDWLAVWGAFGLVGRLGTNAGALFSDGAIILTDFEFGWLFRLLQRQRWTLSGEVSVLTTNYTGVHVGEWIDGIVDGNQVPLVEHVPALRSQLGPRLAWAVNDLFGVHASALVGYGEDVSSRQDDKTSVDLGLATDVDLLARTTVPVGLSLGGTWSNGAYDGRLDLRDAWRAALRVSYIGREDLLIAVDWQYSYLQRHRLPEEMEAAQPTRTSIKLGSISATMRYYF